MAPATRKVCDYPGCTSGPLVEGQPSPFITSAELQLHAEVAEELKLHTETAHILPIKAREAQVAVINAEAAKIREEAGKIRAQNESSRSSSPSSVEQSSTDAVYAGNSNQGQRLRTTQDKDKADEQANLGTLSGSWLLIIGRQDSVESQLYKDTDVFTSELQRDPIGGTPCLSVLSSSQSNNKIRHHIRDSFGKWKLSHAQPHGHIQLTATVDRSAQQQLRLPPIHHARTTQVRALADTGAQMCVSDWQVAKRMGLTKADLLTPALTVSVADNASLELIGAQFMQLKSSTGHTTQQLVYFTTGVGEFYLSKSALIDLQVISSDFPRVGAHKDDTAPQGSIYEVQDGFPSDSTTVQRQSPQGPGLQILAPGAPSPRSLPVHLPPASHWVRPHWGQGHRLWRDVCRTGLGLRLLLPKGWSTALPRLFYNLATWSLCQTVTGHTQYGWRHPQQPQKLRTLPKSRDFSRPAPSAFLLVHLNTIGV